MQPVLFVELILRILGQSKGCREKESNIVHDSPNYCAIVPVPTGFDTLVSKLYVVLVVRSLNGQYLIPSSTWTL